MKIIIRKHGQFFQEVDFSGSELILGRSNDADVQLLHEDISRKHVKISRRSNMITIEDLGSKNGTIFQGHSITKTSIGEGEVFSVGPFTISIESVAPQEQRTVVEHSLEDKSTNSFQEMDEEENQEAPINVTHTSRSAIKPADFPSLSEESEKEEEADSDSFLSAIAVSKKTKPEADIDALNDSEHNEPSESDPIIEYSKPTDPYKDIPDYLRESKNKPKKKNKPKIEKLKEPEEPKTLPYESFSEEQIKTEIRPQPESTMERSLKDFPSASDGDHEVSDSEQFFLNREIDDAGIKETFENFPDTNKIKGVKELDSTFESATEGEIQIDEEPSDAIPTESFSSPETEIVPPDEDHIKTFMYKPADLEEAESEKTDEYSEPKSSLMVKVTQKLTLIKPLFQRMMKNPKQRKIAFFSSALIVGLLMFFAMEGGSMFNSEPVDPEKVINNEEGFQKLGRSEKKRVIAFQIDQIQKLINNKNVAEADDRMRKLMTLASKDKEFVKFEKEYQKQRDLIVAEEERKQKEQEEKEAKRDQALIEAKKMLDNGQYDLAKKTYMRILEIFPDDPDIQDKIQTVELAQEQEERKTFAKKQRYDMLSKIFNEGVQKYESGQLGQAQKLFKQVTAEKGHPRYKKAVEYLARIDTSADKKIDQKVSKAKEMIQNPDTLLAGYQELKKIVSQFPLRADAKKLLADAKLKMDKKARELYADALAQEELAGDPAAALDLYKEVLKYAPDKSNKYNQKAQEKISSLQL